MVIGQAERGRLERRGQADLFHSWFKWNEVVFKSFQADNLKRLDLDTYFQPEELDREAACSASSTSGSTTGAAGNSTSRSSPSSTSA